MLVADFQNQAANPSAYQLGVPVGQLMDSNTIGLVAGANLTVGNAAFLTDLNMMNATAMPSGTAQQFAGIVLRSNENEMQWSDVMQGYSTVVPAGRNASVLTRGTVPVSVSQAAQPAQGDTVWVNITTGAFVTQATPIPGTTPITPPAGCVYTNFRVVFAPTGWTTNTPTLTVITNTKNVGN
jgi:hypothetical protein